MAIKIPNKHHLYIKELQQKFPYLLKKTIKENADYIWRDTECIYCGRSFPDTVIDVSGIFDENKEPQCISKKDCKQAIIDKERKAQEPFIPEHDVEIDLWAENNKTFIQ